MAMAALLRSLATKVARAPPTLLARGLHGGARSGTRHRLLPRRGLHSLPNAAATPPASEMDLVPKIRAGVAHVTLFGTLVYMYGSVLPRLDRLQANLEARNRAELEAALLIDEAIQALELLLEELASTNVPQDSAVHAGHGKQPVGETGKGTRHEDLLAEIAKLKLEVQARSKGKEV
ncbi:unnamed protein product [Urochloa decumbens]|uniref:Uncharacterized protein n=1 Tax=Urochloa decumbens TaxID=240449 RepID=A0ABC8W808_9POAL